MRNLNSAVILWGFFILLLVAVSETLAQSFEPPPIEGPNALVDWEAQEPKAESGYFVHQLISVAEGPVTTIALGPLDVSRLLEEDRRRDFAKEESLPLRIGIGRQLQIGLADGTWSRAAAGWLWRVDLVSSGALGIRLHFDGMNLPEGAEMFIYDPVTVSRIQGPFTGRGWHGHGSMWAPTVHNERVRIACYFPIDEPGDAPADCFTIDALQHVYRDPPAGGGNGPEGNCRLDVSCYSAWGCSNGAPCGRVADAVARLNYVSGSSSYVCSGTLLSTVAGDLTPYLLTASHCIRTPAEALSVECYWFYQTTTCNGNVGSIRSSNVATLLVTSRLLDLTLLMIEGGLPFGLTWAGWDPSEVQNETAVACIHHPAGSFKRIALGKKRPNLHCGVALHLRINWDLGATEDGSSGAGIFRVDTQQLIGAISFGGDCANNDCIGAFQYFFPFIFPWLLQGSDDALEPNGSCAQAVALVPGVNQGLIVKRNDEDWYRVRLTPGQRLDLDLGFMHAFGDVDLELYDACNGSLIAESNGVGNSESISYTNNGCGEYVYVRVFLFSDTRNTYQMATAITTPPPATSCAPSPARMRAWWRFDNPHPNDDTAGDNFLVGAVVQTDGMVGNAASFNGNFLSVPDDFDLEIFRDFSADAWVFVDPGAQGLLTILDKRDGVASGNPRGYRMFISDGRLGFTLATQATPGQTNYTTTAPDLRDDCWHHVAVTYSRQPTKQIVKLFVDGEVRGIFDASGKAGTHVNTAELLIGAGHGATNFFRGRIDEIEIFRAVVPEEDIRAIYEARTAGKCTFACDLPDISIGLLAVGNRRFSICNYTLDDPAFFDWSLQGDFQGTPIIFHPNQGIVAVVPGCTGFDFAFDQPAGMQYGDEALYCLDVARYPSFLGSRCCAKITYSPWIVNWSQNLNSLLPMGRVATFEFSVANVDDPRGTLFYQIVAELPDGSPDRELLQLNGQTPGALLSGSVSVPLGGSASIPFEVAYAEFEPFVPVSVVFRADIDNDGIYETLSSFGLRAAPPFRRGDMNCDRNVNGADIDPFFLAIGDPTTYAAAYPECEFILGDMNGDGKVNGADIDPFFVCLGGGTCP